MTDTLTMPEYDELPSDTMTVRKGERPAYRYMETGRAIATPELGEVAPLRLSWGGGNLDGARAATTTADEVSRAWEAYRLTRPDADPVKWHWTLAPQHRPCNLCHD